jgi:hypothetical protein
VETGECHAFKAEKHPASATSPECSLLRTNDRSCRRLSAGFHSGGSVVTRGVLSSIMSSLVPTTPYSMHVLHFARSIEVGSRMRNKLCTSLILEEAVRGSTTGNQTQPLDYFESSHHLSPSKPASFWNASLFAWDTVFSTLL